MHPSDYLNAGKTIVRMDPNCAICRAPASASCDCESKGLDIAIKQAEQKMMQNMYNDARSWVRAHAQDFILEYFRLLTARRRTAHQAHIDRITAQSYHYHRRPPPQHEIQAAQALLKRGIDEDWQVSVQQYPEVLEYYFGLLSLNMPDDDDPGVKNPPLSALHGGARKSSRRSGGAVAPGGGAGGSGGLGAYAVTNGGMGGWEPPPMSRMTPPPPPALEGRPERKTPGPRHGRRSSYHPPSHHPPPPPGSTYYGGQWGY